jgi:hypothetical protein
MKIECDPYQIHRKKRLLLAIGAREGFVEGLTF